MIKISNNIQKDRYIYINARQCLINNNFSVFFLHPTFGVRASRTSGLSERTNKESRSTKKKNKT